MNILSRLLHLARLRQRSQRFVFAARTFLKDPNLYPLRMSPQFDAELCARMFVRNHAVIHQYVRSIGAKPVTYLQPANGLGLHPLSLYDRHVVAHLRRRITVDGVNQVDALARVYDRINSDPAFINDVDSRDLSRIFAAVAGPLYVDQVHCSDKGYDLIARHIAEELLQRDGQRQESSGASQKRN